MVGVVVGVRLETASGQDATSSNISSTASSSAPTGSSAGTTGSSAGTTDLSATSSGSSGGGAVPINQPSGTGVFSRSPVVIDLSVNGGYDDNVDNASSNGQGSGFTSGNVALSYTFGEPRLQLVLNAVAGGTYYYSNISTQNYDIDLTTTFRINYKATPRLTLASSLLIAYLTEPSFNYGIGLVTRNGNYFYTSDQFSAEYVWTQRFSTLTRYTVAAVKYEDSFVGAFQDRVENTFGNEFRFLAVPTTTLVGEYRFEVISYDQAPLDSTTNFVLAGFDHSFNPQLKATLRGGAEFRSYTQDGDQSGPYFEGNLNYTVGRRTTVSWSNWYGIGEPNVTSAQSRTTFHTGLEGKFDLTSRIGSSINFYYEHSDYSSFRFGGLASPSFTQDSYDAGFSLRFAVNRMLRFQAGYHHTELTSDVGFFAGQKYSRNSVFGGLNLTF
jgi:hypothetical protein